MKNNEAKFNIKTQSGTYPDKVHHGEMKRNAKLINDAPAAFGQILDGPKGITGAKSILSDRFRNSY